MRTWDEPRLTEIGNPFISPENIVDAYPTVACQVANYAIRGNLPVPEQPSFLRRVGNIIIGRDEPDEDSRFLSFEEAAEQTVGQLSLGESLPVIVTESNVRRALINRVGRFNNDLLPSGQRLFRRNDTLTTESQRDRFREALAEQMRFPDTRAELVKNASLWAENNNLEVRDRLETGIPQVYDYIVRGGGISAVNAVSTLQECDPKGRILVIDDGSEDGSELGGQWAKYGDRPTFNMNSKIKEARTVSDAYGLPTHPGDLNSPGLHAILRLADFVGTDTATNIDIRDMVAVNLALSEVDILFANKSDVVDQGLSSIGGKSLRLANTPSAILSRTPVLEAGGAGIPNSNSGNPKIVSPGEVWGWFGKYKSGDHPAEQLAGKTVAIEGCGDSAKVTAKLLLGQGPGEAYHGLSVNQMRPERIVMIASELGQLGTKAAFQAGVRSMYAGLGTYMPDGKNGNYALIDPVAAKSGASFNTGNTVTVLTDNGRILPGLDMVIRARGLTDPATLGSIDREVRVERMRTGRLVDRFGTPYAPFSSGDRIVGIGPFAKLGVNSNAGVPENTASIWANAPAITNAAYELATFNRRNQAR